MPYAYIKDTRTTEGLQEYQIESAQLFYCIIKEKHENAVKFFKEIETSMNKFDFGDNSEQVMQMFEEIDCNSIDIFEFSPFYERFNNFVHTLYRFSNDGLDFYFDLQKYILNDEIRWHKNNNKYY